MERWKLILSVIIYSLLFLFILNNFQHDTIRDYVSGTPASSRTAQVKGDAFISTPQICTNSQRLQRLRQWCKIQENVNNKPFPTISLLETNELRRVVRKLLVDEKHQVLYCDIAKSGSTSWKHILANNTGHYHETKSQSIHGMKYIKEKYNISQLYLMPREEILDKLKHYYKFVVIRHPLDRLISGYRDKLGGGNSFYERVLGVPILRALRKGATSREVQLGRGVTFHEYVTYITNVHMRDQHFENYQDHCHPCVINYDYIAKLETHDVDGKYIINEHLSGYGADSFVNQHSRRGGATLLKPMPEYQNITGEMLHAVTSVYSRDMDMFGYSVVNDGNQILAACGDQNIADCC